MISVIQSQEYFEKLKTHQGKYLDSYKAMYSSWLGGIITDPHLMLLPIDDHMVHRGDGVFEAIKFINNHYYLLDEHLLRLKKSAQLIGFEIKDSDEAWLSHFKEIIFELKKVTGLSDGMYRVYYSRGPGGFTTNPYECVSAQIYIVLTEFKSLTPEKYLNGVSVGISQIPCKSSLLAQAKTCNYLPNVLMKKEAIDQGYDFMVGLDPQGFLTESSTENIIYLSKSGELVRPPSEFILKGLTMVKTLELAEKNKNELNIKAVVEKRFQLPDLIEAQEVMMVGTTLDVLPVASVQRNKIGNGEFKLAKKLLEYYQKI